MDKLREILVNKPLSDNVKKIIIDLYESAVRFWGEDKEIVILEAIKDFEFIFIDDLSDEIVNVQGGTTDNGVGENNIGLTMLIPRICKQKIVDVRRVILLDNKMSDEELASIISHELYFHGVKSMIQPYMSDNILMMGMSAGGFIIDENDEIVKNVDLDYNHGFEELSTYYGQSVLMKETYGSSIKIDLLLLDIANSLGEILRDTSLGELILDAQITKDISKLEDRFNLMEVNRLKLTKDTDSFSWKSYNELVNEFMQLCFKIYRRSSEDSNYDLEVEKYQRLYLKLKKLHIGIYFATLLLDSDDVKKKKKVNGDKNV